MIERIRVLGWTFTLAVVFSPTIAWAQESLNAAEQESQTASQTATDLPTAVEVESAGAPETLEYASLDSPRITNLRQAADATPVVESLQPDDDHAPASPLAAAKGSGTGLGFMIAGAAALVGGLLIGGTGGNLIAAGGVALGVYGIIVYF